MAKKICGTCGHIYYKERRDREITKDGYCYGNPPAQGGIRPKVGLKNQACRLWKAKDDSDNVLMRNAD